MALLRQTIRSEEVAIIVPTFERPEKLKTCLSHLLKLEGGPFPIIVVDDGSRIDLAPICAAAGEGVRYVRQTNAGPGVARTTGAEASRSKWLLFTDDDCRPRPNWALELLRAQDGVGMRLSGGAVVNALPNNVYSTASQSLCTYLYDFYGRTGSEMTFFTTNNLCCLRADFLAQGGFDPWFDIASEDRDFSLRWKDAGGTLVFVENAVVDHAHDLSLTSFWKQHQNYGRGARHLHLRMDGRGDDRPKVEPFGFYAGMLGYPLAHRHRLASYESFLIGLSQVAMVSGYFREKAFGRKLTHE